MKRRRTGVPNTNWENIMSFGVGGKDGGRVKKTCENLFRLLKELQKHK